MSDYVGYALIVIARYLIWLQILDPASVQDAGSGLGLPLLQQNLKNLLNR
jgi:hypothetical protein